MGLKEYNKKRDFNETPEPAAEADKENKKRFVVQRHQASRLHYDLRLEIGGVLKSWAVPKGPSMNPLDKRLAVHTEDHPVKYLYFEGKIPKGNYGAGQMDIWDTGLFSLPEVKDTEMEKAYDSGKLKINFHGKKLRGLFTLVRSSSEDRKNQWLLIKNADAFATSLEYDAEQFTANSDTPKKAGKVKALKINKPIVPMLASTGKKVFNDAGWIYELKYDGYRAIANISDGKVELYSRNGISFHKKFEYIVDQLSHIDQDVVLDGEVVVVNSKGIPQFQELQNFDPDTTKGTLQYIVFDMLHLNGHDMVSLPLLDRKSLIPEIVESLDNVIYCDHIEGMGTALYDKAVKMGIEGVIAKKADSTYSPGYRSESWIKLKKTNSSETIICGFTKTDKARPFGSLILGMMDGHELKYVGNCGSGFSSEEMKMLATKFKPLTRKISPFTEKINLKGRQPVWLEPVYICEVTYTEWTEKNHMRHPVYKGLREDKTLSEITVEHNINNVPTKESSIKPSDHTLEVDGIEVPVSNPDKVYWPDSGLKKYDLLDYYIQVADVMLPYLIDRPQNLHRHPNGINKPGFYQKDNEHLPDWVKTFSIHSGSAEKDIDYLLCQNKATLLYMANLGCIEINPWHSTIHALDNPDYTVIDLDPSPKTTFEQVLETALVTKEILDKAGIPGYCKTSGSRGLHVYIPLGGEYSYDEAVNFTKLLCYFVQERLPKTTTMERSIKKRGNKIYLDYLQNRRGQTIAAAYSVRPKKGATVSTPLLWEEVEKGIRISDFNMHTIPQRIEISGDLFSKVLGKGIDMEKAMENLEAE